MVKSLREAIFGLGGHTVSSLQAHHEYIQSEAKDLRDSLAQASAARQAAIQAIIGELGDIATISGLYNTVQSS